MPRAAPAPSTSRRARRARRTGPIPTPPPAYSPTIDLTKDDVIDLMADSDGEFIPFTPDAQCVIDHMFRYPRPYRHTRRSLPPVAPSTRREGCVTRSQTRQPPTTRDLLAIAEIVSRLPPSFTGITLRDAHDLAHGITSAMRHDPSKYKTLQQLNRDVQEIWHELAE